MKTSMKQDKQIMQPIAQERPTTSLPLYNKGSLVKHAAWIKHSPKVSIQYKIDNP